MSSGFKKATKKEAKARVAISGPAGSGKTYTALKLATSMCAKVALIDTEHGSASKYADEFDFDVLEMDDFHPNNYVQGIKAAQVGGYDGLVIDSISHEWSGKNGCLELSEMYAKKYGGNKWAGWADVTPLHNNFIEAIHGARLHIFATMRSKMDYIQAENEKGKTVIKKVGMAPITREGAEYEFDIFGEMDLDHSMVITKTRCRALTDRVIKLPGEELAKEILAWLSDGAPAEKKEIEKPPTQQKTRATKTKTAVGAVSEVEIKRFYSIANKAGASGGVVNLVISKIKPGLIDEQDGELHMRWDKVRSGSKLYTQLCELFSSGTWQKVWEQIEAEQAEEAAEEDSLGDLDDIDLENLPF